MGQFHAAFHTWFVGLIDWLINRLIDFQINNPDMRVQILKDFVKQHFPATQLLDYALEVEKITTSKVQMSVLDLVYTWF